MTIKNMVSNNFPIIAIVGAAFSLRLFLALDYDGYWGVDGG